MAIHPCNPPPTSGLTNAYYTTLIQFFEHYFMPTSIRIYLFGSRSRGNYRSGSDVDLAFASSQPIEQALALLQEALEESTLPYQFDLVNMQHCDKQFIEIIHQEGILLWSN